MKPRIEQLNYCYRYKLPVLIIGLEMAYLEMPLAAITCIFFSAQLVGFVFVKNLEALFLLVVN